MAGWKDLFGTLQSKFSISKLLTISAAGLTAAREFTFPNVGGKLLINNPFGAAVLSNNAVATTETIVAQWSVAALALVAGDVLNIGNMGQVSSTATLTFRIRMGTAGTTADPLLCTFSTTAAGVVNGHQSLDALIAILSATTATASGDVRLGNGRLGLSAAAFAAAAVNLTVANFISITLVQSIAQTYTSRAAKLSF